MLRLLDIVGQDPVIASLQQCMGGGRMPHALMFVGPNGVGRRTTAMALAAALLCENPQRFPNNGRFGALQDDFPLVDACGKCGDCVTLGAGSHGDFQLVYKELAAFHPDPKVRDRKMQNLGIDVIKHFLIKPAYLAPSRGRGRVFVVREAELMTGDAQNALLKTLEEPPAGVTIVLICRRSEDMLPTTISRCRTMRFAPLPPGFVADALAREEIDPQQAAFWAAFCDGSVGRALRMARGEMYQIKCQLLDALASLEPGGDAKLGEQLQKITEQQAIAAVKAAHTPDGAELSKMLATRRATGTMLELLAAAFRDAITITTGANRPLVNADQRAAVEAIARKHGAGVLAAVVEQLSNYEHLLWRNVNPKIVWDNVVLTCASGK